MKKQIYFSLMLCLGMLSAFAKKDGIENIKVIAKNYTVSSSEKLNIDNEFGKITVDTWEKNEIQVIVRIRANAKTSEKAEALAANVSISEHRAGGTIFLRTQLKNTFNRNGNQSVNIDYEVMMPSVNPLTVRNKFGNLSIGNFKGNLNLDVSYGNIKAGKLSSTENRIKVAFGAADIERLEGADLESSYSKVQIGHFENGELRNSFGKSEIRSANSLKVVQKYGNFEIERINVLVGQIEFCNIEIDELGKSADLILKYAGNADLGTIRGSVEMIKVNASFSTVYMRFDESAALDFSAHIKYGDLKVNNVKIKEYIKSEDASSSTQDFKGIVGKHGGGKMQLHTQYTTVHFQ